MGAEKLIHAEILKIEGAQKLIRSIFSTLLRTKGAQKLVRAEFSTNKVQFFHLLVPSPYISF